MRSFKRRKAGFINAARFITVALPVFFAGAPPSFAEKGEKAVIVHVIDGDTVVAQIGESKRKVRLLGIDAPEKEGPYTHWEPMSQESQKRVEELALDKTVELEFSGKPEEDKHGRLLAYVTLPHGVDLNELLIKEGLAEAFHKFRHERFQRYHHTEKEAKKACRGLWGLRAPCAGKNGKKRNQ